MSDQPIHAPAGSHTEFRYLGGLTGAGLPGYNDNRVLPDGLNDLVFFCGDGQIVVVAQVRKIVLAMFPALYRGINTSFQARQKLRTLVLRPSNA